MRDRLIDALDNSEYVEQNVRKKKFLVYIMGPYKSYPPYDPPLPDDRGVATRRSTLDEILSSRSDELDTDEALDLLITLKNDLRQKKSVNAFLATDPEIPLHEMDAATQSIEYTKAATTTLFIAPAMGDNLGVGIEIGSVCEHFANDVLQDEVIFYNEVNVSSSMVDALSQRWHVTTDDFESYDDLFEAVKAHLREVA